MTIWQPPADMTEPAGCDPAPPPVVLPTPERRADAIMEQHFGAHWADDRDEYCSKTQLWVSIVVAIKAAMGVQAVPQLPKPLLIAELLTK